MRSDIAGRRIGCLHGQRPVRPVKRKRQTFGLHGKLLKILHRFGPSGSCHILFGHPGRQLHHPPTGNSGQFSLTAGKVMDKLQRGLFITPGQRKAIRIFLFQIATLVAFHQKGHDDGSRNGVNTVIVTVPVGFHDKFGAPHAQVGPETGSCFVLRAIHPDVAAAMHSVGQRHPAAFCAAQIASRKAPIHAPMIKKPLGICFTADLPGLRM